MMASSAKRRSKGSKASDGKRKRKHSGSDEDGPAFLSSKFAEPPTSKIYNSRFKFNTPDQLYRADLISAMKMADSEPLAADEYLVIEDPWKPEWEKGVQIPVNPDALPEPNFRILRKRNKDAHLKLPKKLIRFTRDSFFDPDVHVMSYVNTHAERTCRYDMDNLDYHWLTLVNQDREDFGLQPLEEYFIEQVVEELELQSYVNFQDAIKSEEGLGVEYDEDAICDVCRSPDSQETNEMVFCDACNICVHQICYGITKIPEGSWICRTCALGIRPPCVLCPNRGGAMKTTRCGQKWAHVGCAVWIPEVSFLNFIKMEPIVKISQIPPSRWVLVCSLCNNHTGACIQCSEKGCKTAFHVTCAFNEGLQMRASVKNTDDDDALKAYCKKHSNKRSIIFSDSEDDERSIGKRDSLSSEERANLRQQKILEKEAEFYKYVSIDDISELFQHDRTDIEIIYNYWKLKRKANSNRPLLTPKVDSEDGSPEEDADLIFRNKLVHHRRDLERVRNLCYMVIKREKLSSSWLQMKSQIFDLQCSILNSESKLSEDEKAAVLKANSGDLAYDKKYSGDNGPSPNTISVLSNLVGEDAVRTKLNGVVKPSKKNDSRNSTRTPNPYAKHYLNGLLVRTQRFISTASKQEKVQFSKDTSIKKETDISNINSQCDTSNAGVGGGDTIQTSDCFSLKDHNSFSISETEIVTSEELSANLALNNAFDSAVANLKESNKPSGSLNDVKVLKETEVLSEGQTPEKLNSVITIKEDTYSDDFVGEGNSNLIVETVDLNSFSDQLNTQSNIEIEDRKCIYVANSIDAENLKIEDPEYIYIPDYGVGANVKMEQTEYIHDSGESDKTENIEIEEQYDCSPIYNPDEVQTDCTDLNEIAYIYDADAVNFNTLNNEINAESNPNKNVCDTEYDQKSRDKSNSQQVESEAIIISRSETTCTMDELNKKSIVEVAESIKFCNSLSDDSVSLESKDANYFKTSLSELSLEKNKNSSSKNNSIKNSREQIKKLSKENSKLSIRKSNKSLNNKKSSHKRSASDKIKVNDKLDNDVNIISDSSNETLNDRKKRDLSKLNENEGNDEDNIKSDPESHNMDIHVNNTAQNSKLDSVEKNLKLEVKKNNNRSLPLPYVVLKSEDVVKCIKVGDTVKYVKNEISILNNQTSDIKESNDKYSLKEQFGTRKTIEINDLANKSYPSQPTLISKNKSDVKTRLGNDKNSPSRTNALPSAKTSENGVSKSTKVSARRFNPESSPVFSKQPVVKLKHINNLHTLSSVTKTSSSTKCQEKIKLSDKVENNLLDTKDSLNSIDKCLQPVPRKDMLRGYKIPKKPRTDKPEENSLDLRRGNTPLSPLPDPPSSSLSSYHNKAKSSWRKLEPLPEKMVSYTARITANGELKPQQNSSERLVLTLRKDTSDPELQRWKADPSAFNRGNCRRNWGQAQHPPLMPPPFPPMLPGQWSLMGNQVDFRPIPMNYSHGPFT